MITFKQFISEDYTYMYKDKDIDEMSLYDALVLAHEIEYKWSKIKDIKPNLEKYLYNVLLKIYNKYKPILLDCINDWLELHNMDYIRKIDHIVDNFDLDEFINMPLGWPNTFLHFVKKLNLEDKFKNIDVLKIFSNFDYKKSKLLSDLTYKYFNNNKIEKVLLKYIHQNKKQIQDLLDEDFKIKIKTYNNIVNAKKLITQSFPQNINNIMFNMTITLNTSHNQGYLLDDYAKSLGHDYLDIDQINSLSNLPTYKWDKELEQEFEIGSFKGQTIK